MKRQNEVLVGLMTTVAIAVLVLGTFWLARGSFKRGYPLHTVVKWGQGLQTGEKVLLAGVSIGFVDDVVLRMDGTLVINMVVEDRYRIPMGSTATVESAGLLGGTMVAIVPTEPGTTFYAAGDTIPAGKPAPTINDMVASADSLTKSLTAIMSGIQRELIDAGALAELRNVLANTNQLVAQLSQVAADQSAALTKTMATLQSSTGALDSAKIDLILDNFQRASGNVEQFTSGLGQTQLQLSGLLTRLETGEGSAGKLLNDPGLYNDLRAVTANINSMIDDFKTNPRKYMDFSFSIFGGRRQQ
jgi:phospholipid/cholesterol/gamma-HCH transport system substrate-binding protein